MNVSHEEDLQVFVLAAQAVLSLNKDRLSIDSRTIQEISEDIARKALLFKRVRDELDAEQENKRKTWGQLLESLSDEALLDSYYNAKKFMLEQEFINLLLEEIRKRNIDVSLHPTLHEWTGETQKSR